MYLKNLNLRQKYLLIALTLVVLCNLPGLYSEIVRIHNLKGIVERQHIGYQFEGLQKALKGLPFLGYYSDEDFDKNEKASKLFAHAQFTLAPIILDLNNLNREYILFVCSSEEVARQKMEEIGAEALFKNQFGMILAKRRR